MEISTEGRWGFSSLSTPLPIASCPYLYPCLNRYRATPPPCKPLFTFTPLTVSDSMQPLTQASLVPTKRSVTPSPPKLQPRSFLTASLTHQPTYYCERLLIFKADEFLSASHPTSPNQHSTRQFSPSIPTLSKPYPDNHGVNKYRPRRTFLVLFHTTYPRSIFKPPGIFFEW
jgi:hypothetical protein